MLGKWSGSVLQQEIFIPQRSLGQKDSCRRPLEPHTIISVGELVACTCGQSATAGAGLGSTCLKRQSTAQQDQSRTVERRGTRQQLLQEPGMLQSASNYCNHQDASLSPCVQLTHPPAGLCSDGCLGWESPCVPQRLTRPDWKPGQINTHWLVRAFIQHTDRHRHRAKPATESSTRSFIAPTWAGGCATGVSGCGQTCGVPPPVIFSVFFL